MTPSEITSKIQHLEHLQDNQGYNTNRAAEIRDLVALRFKLTSK